MTDTSVTSTENFEAQLNELEKALIKQIREWAGEYNSNAGTIQAANGGAQLLLENLRENSTDPKVVELRQYKEKAEMAAFQAGEKIDQLLRVEVEQLRAEAAEGASGLEEKNATLRDAYKSAVPMVRKLLTQHFGDDNGKKAYQDLVPQLAKDKNGTSSGSGGRRIRHRSWTVSDSSGNGTTQTVTNASDAAKAVDLATADFQAAFFKAAGGSTSDVWPAEVTFTVGEWTVVSMSTAPAQPVAPVTASDVGVAEEELIEEEDDIDSIVNDAVSSTANAA